MTNNEAEYQTLIEALRCILELLREKGEDPARFRLEIQGDSALVLLQVSGDWKARNPRMRRLRDQVRELLSHFGEHQLIPIPRATALNYLGH